jgi:photosystem II stability/assembly factor-like uncharacterized protein
VRRTAAALAVAFAAFPGAASADVNVGHTGWAWGNPTPQGNSLAAIAFSGELGVAVGEQGTILRTEDGGATWTSSNSLTTQPLDQVAMPDASTVIVGGTCSLRRSDDGGRTFRRVPFTNRESPCRDAIVGLAFPTPQSGYLVLRSGAVLRTDNGGRTFSRRGKVSLKGTTAAMNGQASITKVAFGDLDTGLVGLNGFDPNFFRTSDAGATWARAGTTPPAPLPPEQSTLLWQVKGLQFVGPKTAYATGDVIGARMIKTIDGGATWTSLPLTGTDNELKSLQCADALRCVMLARGPYSDPDGALVLTSDGGQTSRAARATTAAVNAAAVTAAGAVVVLGSTGLTVRSPDFGQTFERVGSAATGPFTRLRRGPGNTVFALYPGRSLARSDDGGRGFVQTDALASQPLDLTFAGQAGYALVAGGGVLRTDDGGESWSVLSNLPAPARSIHAVSDDTILAATARGVLRSTDGGQSFARTGGAGLPVREFDRTGGALIAYGPKVLLGSRDGGASWRALRKPARVALKSVDFTDTRHGWAADENWRLWHTTDRGRRWTRALAAGNDDVIGVSFADPLHGFATTTDVRSGGVLRTSDGGRSWRPQAVDSQDLTPTLALGPDSGVAAASSTSHIYVTRTGGDAGVPSALSIAAQVHGRRVTVSGRLRPAAGGERVTVSTPGRRYWSSKRARVGRDGRFKTTWKLRRGAVFVAQWSGVAGVAGDGTPPLRVRLGRHTRR